MSQLRDEDKAAELDGLHANEPLLQDKFVNLSPWAKTSVPDVLAVFDECVIGALRLKAGKESSELCIREIRALASNLKVGWARFNLA